MLINPYIYSTSDCPYAVTGNTLTFGTFSINSNFQPAYGLYGYSIAASIYSSTDLGAGKSITGCQIRFDSYTIPYTFLNQEIWIGQISNSTFPTTTPQVNFSDLTFTKPLVKVKNSFTNTISSNGIWNTFTFDNPYCYDGTGYLLFVWKNYDGIWASGYGTAQCANVVSRGMYKGQDASFPTTGTGTRTNFPLLIKFNY